MLLRLCFPATLALAIMASASVVRAQEVPPADFTIRAPRAASPTINPGAVFTAAFTVVNTTATGGRPTPVVALPTGWSPLTSLVPPTVAANSSDLWLISVAAPANARAGHYVIRAGVAAHGVTASDSVTVSITEHRAVEIRPVPGDGYIAGGDSYDARFTVRNTGNIDSRVLLHATSSRGDRCTLDVAELHLAPGASIIVTARTRSGTAARSVDDVVELSATDAADNTVHAESSIQTTVIAGGARIGDDFWTLPGELAVRAAGPGAGVSAVVATGAGRLSETSATTVDFAVHTRTGTQSLFGERDQYSLGLRSPSGAVLLGDQQYGYSSLTSSGALGFGGEVLHTLDNGLVTGGYVERNRWAADAPLEASAMVGTAPARNSSAMLVLTNRDQGGSTSQIAAASGRTRVGSSDLQVEVAASDSDGIRDVANRERLNGSFTAFTYDLGAQHSGLDFAGPLRGSSDEHLAVSLQQVGPVFFTSTSTMHTATPTVLDSGFTDRQFTSNLTAGFDNGSAIEYDYATRSDGGAPGSINGQEHALQLRGHLAAGPFDFAARIQRGIVLSADSGSASSFTSYGGSIRTMVGRDQYLAAFGELSDGRALGSDGIGTVTAGGSLQLRGPFGLRLIGNASETAPRTHLENWIGQGDLRIEKPVGDLTLALRAHLAQAGGLATAGTNGFFLEVRRPLRIPTTRLNTGGRAQGRLVDAATGKPVVGAMIRLGDQAAITNAKGEVDFQGLDAGPYHASVDGRAVAGNLVTGGERIVIADDANQHPTHFNLTVTQGARVVVRVRRYETAPGQLLRKLDSAGTKDSVGAKLDSLIDVGGVADQMVALISANDTTWLSSDDRGRLDFGSVAPGQYTVAVLTADVPDFHGFEKGQIELTLKAGDHQEVELKMVPKVRAVHVIGPETEVTVSPPKGGGRGGER